MLHTVEKYFHEQFEIIQLKNENCSASVVVNIGNTLFSLKNKEEEILFFPYSLQTYKANNKLAGNPFMHPWANRLEAEYISIDNKRYSFPNEQKHLLFRDANNLPLHGLLLKSDKWKTIALREEENYCYHLAVFNFDDENMLSVFPFKHSILMKHMLEDNTLTIETVLINEDEKDLPISFGFHPYFSRNSNDIQLTIPAINAIEVDDKMIPTGNLIPKKNKWNFKEDTIALEGVLFDDGFQDLKRNESNQANFSINEIKIVFDENYPVAQVYAPQAIDKPYVCIEPMTTTTNAMNTNSCKKLKQNEKFTACFSIIL